MAKKAGNTEAKAPDVGYPSSLRVPAEMKKQLESAAFNRGRSLAAEMLARLANSLEDDVRFGDLESQMFGRMVGDTISFANKEIRERKRKAGENLEYAEWWRERADKDEVRERIIDQIEAQLGKSDRRVLPPADLEERIRAWIDATPEQQFKPEYREAIFQLLAAGLAANPARKLRWNS